MSREPTGRGIRYCLYTAGWGLAIAVCSPYLVWRSYAHKDEMGERFASWNLDRSGFPFWIHASSMGEVRGLLPMIRELSRRDQSPLVTVVTPTAREISAELEAAGAAAVRFAPLDFAPLMSPVIEKAAPQALLISETEIWPSLILESQRRDIPVAFINARLTPTSMGRFSLLRPWLKQMLSGIHVCAQSETDRNRWIQLGCPSNRIVVTGNTKYERNHSPFTTQQRQQLRGGWDGIVVFGSVRSGEITELRQAIAPLISGAKNRLLVIAPRHLELCGQLHSMLKAEFPSLPILIRDTNSAPLVPETSGGSCVLIAQTMGELRKYYALADAGFVGGTFSDIEGHNLFEPADLETPVFYGPHIANVTAVAEALEVAGGGFRCTDGQQMGTRIDGLLESPQRLSDTCAAAAAAATTLGGAVDRTLHALSTWGISVKSAKREDPS
jgi:3-deoxy-D-manno-octulosonic-acid transferase